MSSISAESFRKAFFSVDSGSILPELISASSFRPAGDSFVHAGPPCSNPPEPNAARGLSADVAEMSVGASCGSLGRDQDWSAELLGGT